MGKITRVHEQALTADSTDALLAVYDDWAARYDHDLMKEWGYSTPARVVEYLRQYLPQPRPLILDAGCGTGLVGDALRAAGVTRIEGMDFSEAMLRQAAAKNCYQRLHCLDMNETLPLPSSHYDGVTCVGTFTTAHVHPEALRELVRVTRPGGVLSFSVRMEYWETTGFRGLLTGMDVAGEVRLEELRTEPYVDSEGSQCKLVILGIPG
jgi:predicted TPR repeat methyltransferase